MKKSKLIIIINSIMLLVALYTFISIYAPSLLSSSNKEYASKGGDHLTDGLFLLLLHYANIFVFYVLNLGYIIWSIINKQKNGILIATLSIVCMMSVYLWKDVTNKPIKVEELNNTIGVKEEAKRSETFQQKIEIQEGDIIFQTSTSSQSKAIQLATNSKYSHMGIIYKIGSSFFVYEAIQPVKLTPIADWIKRGKNGHYVIKRLKNADSILTTETLEKMKSYGEKFIGKSYDLYFEWTDDKMYCSELVWKIYKENVNIEIGQLQKLSDFDLSSSIVKQKMKERYGKNIPMDEKVISPAAMFNSELLETIQEN